MCVHRGVEMWEHGEEVVHQQAKEKNQTFQHLDPALPASGAVRN